VEGEAERGGVDERKEDGSEKGKEGRQRGKGKVKFHVYINNY